MSAQHHKEHPPILVIFLKNIFPYVIGILLRLCSLTLVENAAMSPGTPFLKFFAQLGA
jgi:hypothetical protein